MRLRFSRMDEHYLLYIDVLGFSDMVERTPERVDDLFEVVASLNVHNHQSFSAIAFSDTILVHNAVHPRDEDDRRHIVMYQCEFFQDLLHRLAGRGISLRAVLLHGPFRHYLLNGMHYFYGEALNRAYRADKSLQVTGLVMDPHCAKRSHIFATLPYGEWHYVFVTQALREWESYGAMKPLPRLMVHETDLGWYLGPEIEVLAESARLAKSHPEARVRAKHHATLALYRARYPHSLRALEEIDFRMEGVSEEFDWAKVRERMKDSYSWGSQRDLPKPGGTGRRGAGG
jgi:hypothetical protein